MSFHPVILFSKTFVQACLPRLKSATAARDSGSHFFLPACMSKISREPWESRVSSSVCSLLKVQKGEAWKIMKPRNFSPDQPHPQSANGWQTLGPPGAPGTVCKSEVTRWQAYAAYAIFNTNKTAPVVTGFPANPTTKAQRRDFRYSLCLTIDKTTRGCPETRIARAAILPHTHTQLVACTHKVRPWLPQADMHLRILISMFTVTFICRCIWLNEVLPIAGVEKGGVLVCSGNAVRFGSFWKWHEKLRSSMIFQQIEKHLK